MKRPWEWDESDLLALVRDQAQESLTLDFKASKALERTERAKTEITKDVSALANSAGGTLVFGIPENKDTRLAERVDEGVDPEVVTREWLEQVIDSGIQRRIDGVRIVQIPLNATSPGRVAYVVSVPQSFRAPHQSRDKLFYKRFEYRSRPMEEYEIRDVARRREMPDLRIGFQLDFSGYKRVASPHMYPWRIVLFNDSLVPCSEAVVDLLVDGSFAPSERGPLRLDHLAIAEGPKGSKMMAGCRLHWSANGGVSAFQGCPVAVSPMTFIVDHRELVPGRYLVKWKVAAPRTEPKERWVSYLARGPGASGEFGFASKDLTEDEAFALADVRWFNNEPLTHDW